MWTIDNPLQKYNLDFNNPVSLRQYFSFVKSVPNFGEFLGFEFGFDNVVSKYLIGDILMPPYVENKD